ncbi:hypothetical protein MIR68_003733 [Amoeboaphelidium protococcarum]|nr:hypothetical protein MIR68_003733 [Amoeboaphelidium protococcarum]
MKQCHYEVLGVARTAQDDEIKKAYRKLALQWHPDKNPDKVEEATSRFRLIQEAYDILSDPQERSWYDSHRNQILRNSKDQAEQQQYFEDIVDVNHYFSTSVYDGFNDSPNGFYAVYRSVYEELVQQEIKAGNSDMFQMSFGSLNTDYQTLKSFYGYWTSFSTSLDFAWVDKYRAADEHNRRVRRVVGKENKKFREQAKREYNDSVRALTKFVQRRDERWKRLHEEAKAAQEARQTIERRRVAEERAELLRKGEFFQEQEWMKVDEDRLDQLLDEEYEDVYQSGNADVNDGDFDEDDSFEQDFFCVLCDKSFKSDKQLSNHERSKKHQKMEKLVKEQMLKDDELYNQLNDADASSEEVQDASESPLDEQQEQQTDEINSDDGLMDNGAFDQEQELDQSATSSNSSTGSLSSESEYGEPEVVEGIKSIDISDQDEKQHKGDQQEEISSAGTQVNKASQSQTKKSGSRRAKGKNAQFSSSQGLACNVCSMQFETRNKLFRHIEATGHALAVEGGKKRGKRKNK